MPFAYQKPKKRKQKKENKKRKQKKENKKKQKKKTKPSDRGCSGIGSKKTKTFFFILLFLVRFYILSKLNFEMIMYAMISSEQTYGLNYKWNQ